MKTIVSSGRKQVSIGHDLPTVLIGERINPTGKKRLASSLKNGELEYVRKEALDQVEAGADILDVNVLTPGIDEVSLLPRVVQEVTELVDVPLCLDFHDPRALEEALKVYQGKPIINSVTGEEKSLNSILPLVNEYGAAVIGLTMDERGIPKDAKSRVAIAEKIIERAAQMGVEREDVIIDCLALAIGSDHKAGSITLEAISAVKRRFGVNQTMGASNISFAMPNRESLNQSFLSMAIWCGVTCPTLDVAAARMNVLANDLVMGHDRFGQQYIKAFRKHRGDHQGA